MLTEANRKGIHPILKRRKTSQRPSKSTPIPYPNNPGQTGVMKRDGFTESLPLPQTNNMVDSSKTIFILRPYESPVDTKTHPGRPSSRRLSSNRELTTSLGDTHLQMLFPGNTTTVVRQTKIRIKRDPRQDLSREEELIRAPGKNSRLRDIDGHPIIHCPPTHQIQHTLKNDRVQVVYFDIISEKERMRSRIPRSSSIQQNSKIIDEDIKEEGSQDRTLEETTRSRKWFREHTINHNP